MGNREVVQSHDDGARVVTFRDLRKWTGGASKATVHRWIAQGRFPRPIALSIKPDRGTGQNGWLVAELDAWLAERIAARDHDRQEVAKRAAEREERDLRATKRRARRLEPAEAS
jgi:predicted DNA-binding transcriptional regulator AlpA